MIDFRIVPHGAIAGKNNLMVLLAWRNYRARGTRY